MVRRATPTFIAVIGLLLVSVDVAAADDPAVPENSGSGRRVVYDMGAQRVWLVEHDESVYATHLVSGHRDRVTPGVGEFWVSSRSRTTAVLPSRATTMEYMVRFARGKSGLEIGFHSIPYKYGEPLQSLSELGTPQSAGCVRQALSDAKLLYEWAVEGTWVVVVDSSGRAPQAPLSRLPEGAPPQRLDPIVISHVPAVSIGSSTTGWRS
jgi:L,D-transpeptidase catalytic domain